MYACNSVCRGASIIYKSLQSMFNIMHIAHQLMHKLMKIDWSQENVSALRRTDKMFFIT